MSFSLPEPNEKRVLRWYFGGLSATFAHIFIHPLDVIKVGVQLAHVSEKFSAYRYLKYIIATHGVVGLYSGLLSSMRQQFIYSTTRFGLHQKMKEYLLVKDFPFVLDLTLASACGVIGAFIKNPMEIINTRMQADIKLEPHMRYNYRNSIHGIRKIMIVDGYRGFYCGVTLNALKSIAINTSQICFYEQFKQYLLREHKFTDTIGTHITVSALTGLIATILCQPVDFIKVRYITDELATGIRQIIAKQMKFGPLGLYRGTLLTFLKIELQTILTFVAMERMRLHYGLTPRYCTKEERARRLVDWGECIRRLKRREVIEEELAMKKGKLTIIKQYIYDLLHRILSLIRLKKSEDITPVKPKPFQADKKIREKIDQIRKLGGHSKLQLYFRQAIRLMMTKKERERHKIIEAELEEEEEDEDDEDMADEMNIVEQIREHAERSEETRERETKSEKVYTDPTKH